jgi:plastocyanin domain-containing protein
MNKKSAALASGALVIIAAAVFILSAHPQEKAASAAPVQTLAPAPPREMTRPVASQVIEIAAKNGYSPMSSVARAGVPTVLKITTSSTFDCSSTVVIPELRYHVRLPMTGTTEVPIPARAADTKLTGTCGMGMYSFEIKFEN